MDGKHLKPGDTLVMVDRWRPTFVSTQTVAKVGRTWITLTCGRRLLVKTLESEDRSWLYYLDMDHYNNHRELTQLWNNFRNEVKAGYGPPPGVTKEKIHQAAQLLGLA